LPGAESLPRVTTIARPFDGAQPMHRGDAASRISDAGIATGHDHPEISFCAPASRAAMSAALLYHKRLIHIAA